MSEAAARPGLRISELAEEAGVPVATVRHYLREGLLPEGVKTSRNMAYYPPELVERIRTIKQLQEERFMPLRVIGEVLERSGGDPERLQQLVEASGRVVERALDDERGRTPVDEVGDTYAMPAEVLERLADLGVLSPDEAGYSPSDVRIVAAISRFRAGGYDETIGFTVHDAARFLAPLEDLARREVELLAHKLVGSSEPERAVELLEAGIEPLRELIAAMHSKLLAAELERHATGGE
jgi:DNA-binding transcriptional MerR regulator